MDLMDASRHAIADLTAPSSSAPRPGEQGTDVRDEFGRDGHEGRPLGLVGRCRLGLDPAILRIRLMRRVIRSANWVKTQPTPEDNGEEDKEDVAIYSGDC